MPGLNRESAHTSTTRRRHIGTALTFTAARFGLVGILNSCIGLATIYVAKWAGGFGDGLANLIGYSIGLLSSFLLNRSFTFKSSNAYGPALIRFLLVVGVAYVANLAVVLIGVRWLTWNSYAAQAVGIIPYTSITYFGCKLFVFGRNPKAAPSSG